MEKTQVLLNSEYGENVPILVNNLLISF